MAEKNDQTADYWSKKNIADCTRVSGWAGRWVYLLYIHYAPKSTRWMYNCVCGGFITYSASAYHVSMLIKGALRNFFCFHSISKLTLGNVHSCILWTGTENQSLTKKPSSKGSWQQRETGPNKFQCQVFMYLLNEVNPGRKYDSF